MTKVAVAAVLDTLGTARIAPAAMHFSCAMGACRKAGNTSFTLAEYFLNQAVAQGVVLDVRFFTALMRTYGGADVRYFTTAYEKMKSLGIQPDQLFAEAYLVSLLEKPSRQCLRDKLRELDRGRLRAASEALLDFETAEVQGCSL